LNVPGLGDGEGEAALAVMSGERATAVAPTTPPKAMAAATVDAKTRVRVLFITAILSGEPHNGLGIGCEF
jgi:hypothetical protein